MARKAKTGEQGRGCGILFGLGWTLFSSMFVAIGLWTAWKSVATRTWDEVPCTIDRFEISAQRDADPPFRPELEFGYEAGGAFHTGTRLWKEKEGADRYEDLAEIRAALLVGPEGPLVEANGTPATCRVNPANSAEAVLVDSPSEQLWFGLAFAAFGGMFVLVGIGLLTAMGRKGNARTAKSGGGGKLSGGLLAYAFFGVFAVAGLGMVAGLVVPTAWRFLSVQRWVATPAEVVWGTVRSHSGDDGTTYSVDIFYRYEFDGTPQASNRWGLVGGSSSGRDSKREIVRAHPPGSALTCYVDPDRPWRAIVRRRLGWWALFGLFPLPFLAVGFGGLWHLARGKRTPAGDATPEPEAARFPIPARPPEGRTRFGSSRGKRIAGFVGTLFFAAFWNGGVSVFVWKVWQGFEHGRAEWFLTLFMVPFVLVGLLLLLAVPYAFLAIFSPTYQLALSEDRLKPGGRARLSWQRSGGGGEPRKLTLWLVGREEASYQRGTSRTTATSVFHEEELFSTTSPPMMPGGRCDVAIPRDAMPTFHRKHNKLLWFVKVVVDVPWRPDVHEEHEIVVVPLEREDLPS